MHTYPTIEFDANASNSFKEDASTRIAWPDCSKVGSPVFSPGEAIVERRTHISRVRSRSSFSSITSAFKSASARMPRTSGTFALPSCRRLDQEKVRACCAWINNGCKTFSSQASHISIRQRLTKGIKAERTSYIPCLNSIDCIFSISVPHQQNEHPNIYKTYHQ